MERVSTTILPCVTLASSGALAFVILSRAVAPLRAALLLVALASSNRPRARAVLGALASRHRPRAVGGRVDHVAAKRADPRSEPMHEVHHSASRYLLLIHLLAVIVLALPPNKFGRWLLLRLRFLCRAFAKKSNQLLLRLRCCIQRWAEAWFLLRAAGVFTSAATILAVGRLPLRHESHLLGEKWSRREDARGA